MAYDPTSDAGVALVVKTDDEVKVSADPPKRKIEGPP